MSKKFPHDQAPCPGLPPDPAASAPLEAVGRKKRAPAKAKQAAQPALPGALASAPVSASVSAPSDTNADDLTPDYVLNRLRQVAESCLASEPINASAANKALELLGKHLGVFSDKRGTESEQDDNPAPLAETVIYRIPDNDRD